MIFVVAGFPIWGFDTCQLRVFPRLRREAHHEQAIEGSIDVDALPLRQHRQLVPFLAFQAVVAHSELQSCAGRGELHFVRDSLPMTTEALHAIPKLQIILGSE
jgi:hypothetical protein